MWAASRSGCLGSECVPDNLLESDNANLVCKSLCQFAGEAKRVEWLQVSSHGTAITFFQENKAQFSVLTDLIPIFKIWCKPWLVILATCMVEGSDVDQQEVLKLYTTSTHEDLSL